MPTDHPPIIKPFLGSEYPQTPPEQALFHIIPAPFEATVSYGGGTAVGPEAIIAASDQLERYDGHSCPGDEGIHTWPEVDCRGTPREVLPRIGQALEKASRAHGNRPVSVLLGGEHSITAPAVAAMAEKLREETGESTPLGVIQIDAHADLRQEYEGSSLSHASVMRRIHEDLNLPVIQLGVRALCTEEADYRRRTAGPSLTWCDGPDLVPSGAMEFAFPENFPHRIYLTLDVDGLDPSLCPATGTPVPGGLGWYQTLGLLEWITSRRDLVAFDMVELAPIPGVHAADYAVAELTYRIMGMISRSRTAPA
ncbi:agmatinase [Alkalispirochaeta americana]|uniref:Agmatinase n=1 Tax=Alkalispirochaeta americana TaxID=159291 RepID=A0A1N6WDG3_9SPIO|nr:agmatinase family protein [Alkalispirochaeta americana]SIQ88124.1 agmatinase [Alkalispirochaeta americana]